MSSHSAQDGPREHGLLLLELDGAGSHPAAWRVSRTAPAAVLGPEHLRGAVLAAESAGFHAATFSDPGLPAPGHPDAAARLNALQRAAFAGPVTRSLALIPEVDTAYTEPFHISTQLASLDYVSGGRTGWLVPAQNPPALAEAILDALRHEDKAIELARNGEALAREHFDVQKTAAQVLMIYKQILSRRSASAGLSSPSPAQGVA